MLSDPSIRPLAVLCFLGVEINQIKKPVLVVCETLLDDMSGVVDELRELTLASKNTECGDHDSPYRRRRYRNPLQVYRRLFCAVLGSDTRQSAIDWMRQIRVRYLLRCQGDSFLRIFTLDAFIYDISPHSSAKR